MTTIARNLARYCALSAVAAGIGAGALGLAGMASADPAAPTTTTIVPSGPGYQYYPDTYATPPATQTPGWQGHHGPGHLGG